MTGRHDPSLAELRARAGVLDEQVKRLVRVEHQLRRSEIALDQQLDRIEALNRFALAASGSHSQSEILGYAIEMFMSLFAVEQGLGFALVGGGQLLPTVASSRPGCEEESAKNLAKGTLGRSISVANLPGEPASVDRSGAEFCRFSQLVQAIEEVYGSQRPGAFHLYVPLLGQEGGIVGIILLRHPTPQVVSMHDVIPKPTDFSFIRVAAAHIASALDNAIFQQEVAALGSQVAHAEGNERRRIAAGLHDDMGQILAGLKLRLECLAQDDKSLQENSGMSEALDLLQQAITKTRTLTFELVSPALYELGLEVALEELLVSREAEYGISMTWEDDGEDKPLSDEVRGVLYRAVSELVFNVAKHAQADAVMVRCSREMESVRISVTDDGRGFEVGSVLSRYSFQSGYGLFNIRERMAYLGGQCVVKSTKGKGTTVVLMAPLSAS